MSPKHFLSLRDVSVQDIQALVQRAIQLKRRTQSQQKDLGRRRSGLLPPLTGKTLSLIFSKRSTRTRVSAETGWAHYGGQSLFLGKNDIQMGSGEPIQDTARVVSSMTDAIFARLGPHEDIEVDFHVFIEIVSTRITHEAWAAGVCEILVGSRDQCPHRQVSSLAGFGRHSNHLRDILPFHLPTKRRHKMELAISQSSLDRRRKQHSQFFAHEPPATRNSNANCDAQRLLSVTRHPQTSK